MTFNDEVISVSTENLDPDISEIDETKRVSIETLNDILDDNEEEEEVHANEFKEKSKDGTGDVRFWYYCKLEENKPAMLPSSCGTTVTSNILLFRKGKIKEFQEQYG